MSSENGAEAVPPLAETNEDLPTLVPADPAIQGEPTVLEALKATLAKVAKAAGLADPVEMVHDARKAMKEYRGLLRLVPTSAAKLARQETATAARALSAARDRAAALEALEALQKSGLLDEADKNAAATAIGTDPDEARESESHRTELAAFLAAAQARLAEGLAEEAAAADLVAGLSRAYRKARRGRFDSPPHMHETRKRVIDHRYQMSFFAQHHGGRGTRRATQAQALRDLLGAYQDLETLRPMVAAQSEVLGEEATGRIMKAMARRQKRLKRDALHLHRKLFRRRPKTFARKYRSAPAP